VDGDRTSLLVMIVRDLEGETVVADSARDLRTG